MPVAPPCSRCRPRRFVRATTRLVLAALAATALPTAGRTQAHATDLLSLAGGGIFNNVLLYELDPSGQWSLLQSFPVTQRPGTLCMHTDNRTLVLNGNNPFAVVLFAPDAHASVRTLHAGSPLRDVLAIRPFHTGDYLVAEGLTASTVLLVRADGSGASTLLRAAGRIDAVAEDLFTGDVLATIDSAVGPSLVRVDPRTLQTTVLDQAPRDLESLVQDHRDGALYYGDASETIWRRDAAGAIHAFLTGSNASGVQAHSLAFDRAAGNGILVAGGSRRIARVAFAPGGAPTVVAVHGNLPPNPMAASDLAFRGGRNLSSILTGAGNRWSFELSFPDQAGAGYLLAFSASGFTPGLPVGSRTLPLVPDAVLAASVFGGLAPFLQHGGGVLDGAGRATATLDLSSLPSLAGIRLWAAAVTFDPRAPAVVATISKPIVLALQ